MYSKPFRFTEPEAKIVARWEIGVQNYVSPLTGVLFALIGLIEVLRYVLKMPVAPISFYIADVAAIIVFVVALRYIGKRVDMTARDIMKRELAVDFNDEQSYFAVVEYGGRLVFRAHNNDVEKIDIGPNVVRLDGKAGAICLPVHQVPEAFLVLMQKQLGVNGYKAHKWM